MLFLRCLLPVFVSLRKGPGVCWSCSKVVVLQRRRAQKVGSWNGLLNNNRKLNVFVNTVFLRCLLPVFLVIGRTHDENE